MTHVNTLYPKLMLEFAPLPSLSQGYRGGVMHSRCPPQGSQEWTDMNAGQESKDRRLNMKWTSFMVSFSILCSES